MVGLLGASSDSGSDLESGAFLFWVGLGHKVWNQAEVAFWVSSLGVKVVEVGLFFWLEV